MRCQVTHLQKESRTRHTTASSLSPLAELAGLGQVSCCEVITHVFAIGLTPSLPTGPKTGSLRAHRCSGAHPHEASFGFSLTARIPVGKGGRSSQKMSESSICTQTFPQAPEALADKLQTLLSFFQERRMVEVGTRINPRFAGLFGSGDKVAGVCDPPPSAEIRETLQIWKIRVCVTQEHPAPLSKEHTHTQVVLPPPKPHDLFRVLGSPFQTTPLPHPPKPKKRNLFLVSCWEPLQNTPPQQGSKPYQQIIIIILIIKIIIIMIIIITSGPLEPRSLGPSAPASLRPLPRKSPKRKRPRPPRRARGTVWGREDGENGFGGAGEGVRRGEGECVKVVRAGFRL